MISRLRKWLWQSAGLGSGDYAGGWSIRTFLTTLSASLGALIVLPLLLLEALRGTLPLEGNTFWGVWYQHLVLALLFLAVLVVLGLAVRLRAHLWWAGGFGLAGLFSAWPFLLALREHLSLSEVLLGQPIFSHWPSYLQPMHLLVEVVLPLAFLGALWVAVQDFWGQEKRGYAGLAAAGFLLVALYLGWLGLQRSGQPTLFARWVTKGAGVEQKPPPSPSPAPAESETTAEGMPTAVEPQPSAKLESAPPAGELSAVPPDDSSLLLLRERVEQLQARVERLEARYEQANPALAPGLSGEAEAGRSTVAPQAEEEPLNGILRQLESLSSKVDQLGAKLGPPVAPPPRP